MEWKLSQKTKDLLMPTFNSKEELYIYSPEDKDKNPLFLKAVNGLRVKIKNPDSKYGSKYDIYMLKNSSPYNSPLLTFVREDDFFNYWSKLERPEDIKKQNEDKFNADFPVGSLITFKHKNESECFRTFGYIKKKARITDSDEVVIYLDKIEYNGRTRTDATTYSLDLFETEFFIVSIEDVYKHLFERSKKRLKDDKENLKLAQKNIKSEKKNQLSLKKNLKITVEEQLKTQ